jgi:hypothetical protein
MTESSSGTDPERIPSAMIDARLAASTATVARATNVTTANNQPRQKHFSKMCPKPGSTKADIRAGLSRSFIQIFPSPRPKTLAILDFQTGLDL